MSFVFKKKPSRWISPPALIILLGLCGCSNDKIHRIRIPINKSDRNKTGTGANQSIKNLPQLVEILQKLEAQSNEQSKVVTTDYEIRSKKPLVELSWEIQHQYFVQLLKNNSASPSSGDLNSVRVTYLAASMSNILSQFGELFKVTNSTNSTISFTVKEDSDGSIKTFRPSSKTLGVANGFSLDIIGEPSNEVRVYRFNKIGSQKQIQATVWKTFTSTICQQEVDLQIGITQMLQFGGDNPKDASLIRVSSRLVDFLKNNVTGASNLLSSFKEDFWIQPKRRTKVGRKSSTPLAGTTDAPAPTAQGANPQSYDFSVKGFQIPSNLLEGIYKNIDQKQFISSECSR